MTAVLVRRASARFELELRADGTFVYVHDGSQSKKRSLYLPRVRRHRVSHARHRVDITVEDVPNNPPFVVAPVPDQEADGRESSFG